MVLSVEEFILLVEYVFREGKRYTDLVLEQFAEEFPETPVTHRYAARTLIEKFRKTGLYEYRRSWTSLPTIFISAQQLSERTVYMCYIFRPESYCVFLCKVFVLTCLRMA
jgi:hypothetical protein